MAFLSSVRSVKQAHKWSVNCLVDKSCCVETILSLEQVLTALEEAASRTKHQVIVVANRVFRTGSLMLIVNQLTVDIRTKDQQEYPLIFIMILQSIFLGIINPFSWYRGTRYFKKCSQNRIKRTYLAGPHCKFRYL